jgi:hypothetical protein
VRTILVVTWVLCASLMTAQLPAQAPSAKLVPLCELQTRWSRRTPNSSSRRGISFRPGGTVPRDFGLPRSEHRYRIRSEVT